MAHAETRLPDVVPAAHLLVQDCKGTPHPPPSVAKVDDDVRDADAAAAAADAVRPPTTPPPPPLPPPPPPPVVVQIWSSWDSPTEIVDLDADTDADQFLRRQRHRSR